MTASLVPVYRCYVSDYGTDHYATLSATCEGAARATLDGQILGFLDAVQETLAQVPIIRCVNPAMRITFNGKSRTVLRHLEVAGSSCPAGWNFDANLGCGQP